MNMTDIECFLCVARLMSFSKAAEELYLSQQAVSIRIKNLESTYQVQLFERKPALKLTEAGKILLESAKEMSTLEERLRDNLSASRNQFGGELSIGLPPNRSAAFASDLIPRFSSLYPDITLRLMEMPSANLLSEIKMNRIDLALPLFSVSYTIPEEYLYHSKPLETENSYLVISDELLQRHFPEKYPDCIPEFERGIDIADFASVPMFLRPSSSHLHAEIEAKLHTASKKPFIRLTTTMTSAMLPLCADGYGVLFCPPMILDYLYQENPTRFAHLHVFPLVEDWAKRKTHLVYHKTKYLSQPLRDCIEMIQEIYAMHNTYFQKVFRGGAPLKDE